MTSADVDDNPQELEEWRDALLSVAEYSGADRARQIMDLLVGLAQKPAIDWQRTRWMPYVNTIPVQSQPTFPGDLMLEERLVSIMRWNALAMVLRANKAYGEPGGHISSYTSAADLFEVGFNHFFHARNTEQGGDLIFYQPHSAPGIYARAFLEGRLRREDLEHYRQEITADTPGARGLPSYPHPWLMPDFRQFPTGSMGIGPISSIYQARFMRYLQHRGLLDTAGRTVWGVFGDGEMDEPESMSALTLAARERLDNLVWVVNCNLQRLDGPVRGNGCIIDELESLFLCAGWNVIKLVWGSDWDGLFARDADGELTHTLSNTVDGQLQTFAAKDGRYTREDFFGQSEALAIRVEGAVAEIEIAEVAAQTLASYAGTYTIEAYGVDVQVSWDGEHLMFEMPGQPAAELFASSTTDFFFKVAPSTIEFFINESGDISHLELLSEGTETRAEREE